MSEWIKIYKFVNQSVADASGWTNSKCLKWINTRKPFRKEYISSDRRKERRYQSYSDCGKWIDNPGAKMH